jgi:hypothetical protein
METIEKQVHVVILKTNGKYEILCSRFNGSNSNGTVVSHEEMVNLQLGDSFGWNKSDFNMSRVDGVIVAKRVNDWNYSKKVGERAENVISTPNFAEVLKIARNN